MAIFMKSEPMSMPRSGEPAVYSHWCACAQVSIWSSGSDDAC